MNIFKKFTFISIDSPNSITNHLTNMLRISANS